MTLQDQFLLALTAWRENRGGGAVGMQSVMNVIINRAASRKTSPYSECVRKWQFSSITATGDPELVLWPADNDAQFVTAQGLVAQAVAGTLQDITGNAKSYYALSMKTAPAWAATMTKTVEINGQVFFK